MSNTTTFNLAGEGTEMQKKVFQDRQLLQEEKYRELRIDQLSDEIDKYDIRQMMRTRDHEMELKYDLDNEAIERQIDAQLMKAGQPALDNHLGGGRKISRLERRDAIRRDTYASMRETFAQENVELLQEKNQEIDAAIDQSAERQEQAQSIDLSEGLSL